ncbi:hypothetical protein D3C72_826290 [compost metagenome]
MLLDEQLHLAGLDLGEVEDVVDQGQEVPPGALDLLEIGDAARQAVVLGLFLEHLGVADDGVQGRAQLVAHVREKAALGLAGQLGLDAGLAQSVVGALALHHPAELGADVAHGLAQARADGGLVSGIEHHRGDDLPPAAHRHGEGVAEASLGGRRGAREQPALADALEVQQPIEPIRHLDERLRDHRGGGPAGVLVGLEPARLGLEPDALGGGLVPVDADQVRERPAGQPADGRHDSLGGGLEGLGLVGGRRDVAQQLDQAGLLLGEPLGLALLGDVLHHAHQLD